jgi:Domain of unknown function (DUF397)
VSLVETPRTIWRKSSRSGHDGETCVEMADLGGGRRGLRDSKQRGDGPVLVFTAAEWAAFIEGVKLGEFD